jgi:hypothetical protein
MVPQARSEKSVIGGGGQSVKNTGRPSADQNHKGIGAQVGGGDKVSRYVIFRPFFFWLTRIFSRKFEILKLRKKHPKFFNTTQYFIAVLNKRIMKK